MSVNRLYPVGIQDFQIVRQEGFVYVDKTKYVYDLAGKSGRAIFLSRPRRFGKSLLCSTMKYYFLGRRELFEGLAIASLEHEWTQYPVFHFDMSNCKSDVIDEVSINLDHLLSNFEKTWGCDKGNLPFGARLRQLIETAYTKTGKRVVLIFDEYDSPMLHVINSPEKVETLRSLFNTFYGPVKSMNEYLRFVFITGVTKFSQMSIFSTINNIKNISLLPEYEGLCGITTKELTTVFAQDIESLAAKLKITPQQALQRLRDRYDGYRFGPDLTEVYNPFSLVNAFDNMRLNDYWFDSATPSALIPILEKYNFRLSDIEGAELYLRDFDRPYDNLFSAIPILYQSGYLTLKKYNNEEDIYTLGIPNQEVYAGLYSTLMPYYLNSDFVSNTSLIRVVRRAILNDDIDSALEGIKNYLSTLPYDLSNKTERDFETIIKVIFDCVGIETQVEVKNARGRCDVVMKNHTTIYVLELKIDGSATVDDALAQINEKNYLIPYWNDERRKVKVGVVVDPEIRTLKEWKVAEGE